MIYIDQLMREVKLSNPPSRIVSLVPSLTELLYDLGLENQIAGITKFCIHPEIIFRTKTRVGGTKKVNLDTIKRIHPDLIIANKEENLKSDIEQLQKSYPVWVSDISTLEDALQAIQMIGTITDRINESEKLNKAIAENFRSLQVKDSIKTLYLIWKNPYMAAGKNTFIDDMMQRCGFVNVLVSTERYPSLTDTEIQNLNPELILLSSEPFPFKREHIEELKQIVPNSVIVTVDGECFSWYGSHLLKSPDYFKNLLNQLDKSKTTLN